MQAVAATRDLSPTVFVVDDDRALRSSLAWLLESVAMRVEAHASAEAFLNGYDPARPGCLVLDVRLPGMSGLTLQESLAARDVQLPIIFLTGFAEVRTVVEALKGGAFDFLEKPFSNQQMIERVQQALRFDAERRRKRCEERALAARLALLTQRERDVMRMVTSGKPNKVTADELGLSIKTVEAHRARVMQKLQVQSLPDLVRVEWRVNGSAAKYH